MATKKEIEKYLNLPWSYTIEQENDYFIVRVKQIPGVCTDGETIEEALLNIEEALYGAVEAMLDAGVKIPIPGDA